MHLAKVVTTASWHNGSVPFSFIRDPDQLQGLLEAVLSIESDLEPTGVLRRIAGAACKLTGARYGALGVLDLSGKRLAAFAHVGMDDEAVKRIGRLPEGEGILGLLILDPKPLRLADLSTHPDSVGFPPGHPPMKSFMGVPIVVRGEVFGNLYLTEKRGAAEFTADDEALVVALAAGAGIAIENARLHTRLSELAMASDRERIARDLHDTVIQRLFATGLSLQSALPLAQDVEMQSRITEAISDLDATIRQVRTTIFALEPPPTALEGVRSQVLDICAEASRSLGFEPELRFGGAIDSEVGGHMATELLATLREALSNVARHALAGRVEVEVSVSGDVLHLRVADDGTGFNPDSHGNGNGLTNMAQRAESLGGAFSCSVRPQGGTELTWRVPLGG